MNRSRILLLLIFLLNAVILQAQNPIGLRASAMLRGLPIGTAIRVDSLRENIDAGQYNYNVIKNYQVVVPEGELKPEHIWIGENLYNFTDSDWLIGWTQQNQMKLRGHNLVWATDKHIPHWLVEQESSITPDRAISLLSDYIHTVVGRYRGKIPWWDVINEAIEDSNNNTHPFNLRDCFWFRKLGPDYIKYAFQFAHEADPDLQLYYNDYNIEFTGRKTNRTIELVNWLRSQGVIIHGIGIQWHTSVTTTITPGDQHYRSAQQFVDNNLDIMVTELDVSIPVNGGYPINTTDLEKQGLVYLSMLEYVLYFFPRCRAFLTWGFTDRYSWIPESSNHTRGDALPLDWMYLPKAAYWKMQEKLARVIADGIYRISPQSQPDKCLGTTTNGVQLYNDQCNESNQKWNITWLGDGTYRLSSLNASNYALTAYNTTATTGTVDIISWTGDFKQEWALSLQGSNIFNIGPRQAWWRVMTVYNNSNIGIIDRTTSELQSWILTTI